MTITMLVKTDWSFINPNRYHELWSDDARNIIFIIPQNTLVQRTYMIENLIFNFRFFLIYWIEIIVLVGSNLYNIIINFHLTWEAKNV